MLPPGRCGDAPAGPLLHAAASHRRPIPAAACEGAACTRRTCDAPIAMARTAHVLRSTPGDRPAPAAVGVAHGRSCLRAPASSMRGGCRGQWSDQPGQAQHAHASNPAGFRGDRAKGVAIPQRSTQDPRSGVGSIPPWPPGRGNRPAGTDRVIARSHGSPRGSAGTHAGTPGWMEDRQQVSLPASRRGCGQRRRPPNRAMQQRETGDIRHSATLARTHARSGRTRGTRQSFRPAWEG